MSEKYTISDDLDASETYSVDETDSKIIQKSVHEIAHQMQEVHGNLLKKIPPIFDLLDLLTNSYKQKPPQTLSDKESELLNRMDDIPSVREHYVVEMLTNFQQQYPAEYQTFLEMLREARRDENKRIKNELKEGIENKKINEQLRSELNDLTFVMGKELSEEKVKELQANFPSGNYLLHTTRAQAMAAILASKKIITSHELSEIHNEHRGYGGGGRISLNFNNVRVMNSNQRHIMGFLMSPEAILNDNNELVITPGAAQYEVALSPKIGNFFRKTKPPVINIKDTYIFANHADSEVIKDVLAANNLKPKGIIVFPATEIRVESWIEPKGDFKKAGQILNSFFQDAGIINTIDWEEDLFEGGSPHMEIDTYVSPSSAARSKTIIKEKDKLKIINSD